MTFSDIKRLLFLPFIYSICFIFIFSPIAQAADIQAQLDSTGGGSGFSVQDSTSAEKARIDSNGNLTTHGNAGIGTTTPGYTLDVNGDIGNSTSGMLILQNHGGSVSTLNNVLDDGLGDGYFAGNVGIGSLYPGTPLDVNGIIRSISGGYAFPDGTTQITAATGGNSWTITGGNVYTTNRANNVGIGTYTPQGGLVVTNGNVGIGTWAPNTLLAVGANAFTVNASGAIATSGGYTQSGPSTNSLSGTTLFAGNVGINSTAPGEELDVHGEVRTVNFAMSGNTPMNGYVLTAMDTFGNTTWSTPGGVSGWTNSGINVYETNGGNVGIGTAFVNAGAALSVMNGNVGIGTWAPTSSLEVEGSSYLGSPVLTLNNTLDDGLGDIIATGNIMSSSLNDTGTAVFGENVGIGSSAPGQMLDVNGTVRMTGLAMSGNTPMNGYVLTAIDTFGNTTWSTPGGVSGWTNSGINVYETNGGNVGIGTAFVNAGAALSVMNGNVGIGTWAPSAPLTVGTNAFMVNSNGAITASNGIATIGGYTQTGVSVNTLSGTTAFSAAGTSATFAGNVGIGTSNPFGGNLIINGGGNVGIGSLVPGQRLDVNGTVRMVDLAMSGSTPMNGYVLTAIDTFGNTTWSTPGGVSGWTISGINVYETNSGNVGIGTTNINAGAALSVMNGNVGIGTWAPSAPLTVGTNAFMVNSNGAITATTGITTSGGYAQSGSGINALTGNVGIAAVNPLSKLNVNGGVGIGTSLTNAAYLSGMSAPSGGLIVQGNVGIGTFNPFGGNLIVNGGGNVGIGSLTPGQLLDINGTTRTSYFVMSSQSPVNGDVLTAVDTFGNTTWSTPGGVSGWTISGINVYETNSGNVGIGTTNVNAGAALSVMNGNVGIGTWAPSAPLSVGPDAFMVNINGAITATTGITTSGGYAQSGSGINALSGNVGIATVNPLSKLNVNGGVGIGTSLTNAAYLSGMTAPSGGLIVQGNVGIGTFNPFGGNLIVNGGGNVGIGTLLPGVALDVNGSVRSTGFTMSGNTPMNGFVLTATDTYGDTTWSSLGIVTGWTTGAGTVYTTTGSNNVGIGTSTPQGGLIVTNGNVGIATWNPVGLLQINSPTTSPFLVGSNGNVGIGTVNVTAGAALSVMNGNVGIGTWVPAAPLTVGANAFTVNSNGAITATAGITTSGGYTQSGSGINSLSGNVGIATINPLSKLNVNGGVGIGTSLTNGAYLNGTSAPSGGLIVQGNVGIGTFNPFGGQLIIPTTNGNVGIGTLVPGQALDVNGTLRTTYFTMSSQSPMNGYVLTAADTYGNTTWTSPGIVGGWTIAGNELYTTTITSNVGIGTINPLSKLNVNGGVGIGTSLTNGNYLNGNAAPSGGLIVQGNVGFGTWAPTGALEVEGGNVGIGTWLAPSGGANNLLVNGNVGVGTTFVGGAGEGSLAVMNGNVGIGTWLPFNALDLKGSAAFGTYAGKYTAPSNSLIVSTNLGIGTYNPNSALIVASGNVGIGTAFPGQVMDVNGTLRTTYFTMSSQSPMNGYVLTAADTYGNTTWTSPGIVGGWTISGNEIYTTTITSNVGIGTINPLSKLNVNGGVGIGTSLTNGNYLNGNAAPSGGLIVQGNVGFGTWAPTGALEVEGGNVGIGTWLAPSGGANNLLVNGNVGVGTTFVGGAGEGSLAVMNGNVGIGTWLPFNALDLKGSAAFGTYAGKYTAPSNSLIVSTNLGIGTYNPNSALIVVSGNVGIGTAFPGQVMDVNGTLRTTYFTMSSQSPMNGYVLTAADTYGNTTWTSPGIVGGWTISGNEIYTTTITSNVGIGTINPLSKLNVNGGVGIGTSLTNGNYLNGNAAPSGGLIVQGNVGFGTWTPTGALEVENGNVGIGTAYTTTAGLTVMNGNVGIGTWLPSNALDLKGSAAFGTYAGKYTAPSNSLIVSTNIGIGTYNPNSALIVASGNVGIGTAFPGQVMDVNGTLRTTYFTMSSQSPMNGYVLTAADTYGNTTWTSPGLVGGWTISGNELYATTISNNVGIGTINPLSKLNVNGGVGIGTSLTNGNYLNGNAAPSGGLIVQGNVGFGTWAPTGALEVEGGNVGIGTWLAPSGGANNLLINGNVGVGTTFVGGAGEGSLAVMNGNVGIGTWIPGAPLTIGANAFTVNNTGAITATTGITTSGGYTQSGSGINSLSGNVGIATINPLSKLNVNGGVGIGTSLTNGAYLNGTSAPSGGLIVQGNVGIGTFNPFGGNLIVNGGGNVGIGSLVPGQALDVTGTIRTQYLALSAQSPVNGDVLTALDTFGNTTWSSLAAVTGWTVTSGTIYTTTLSNVVGIGTLNPLSKLNVNGGVGIGTSLTNGNYLNGNAAPSGGLIVQGNVGFGTWAPTGALEVENGNVGIGTAFTSAAGLTVMNGNVGIGTWLPFNSFDVKGSGAFGTYAGQKVAPANSLIVSTNIGIGTYNPNSALIVASGNVGIGTAFPGQVMDVNGTLRTTYFTMSSQSPMNGYVLTAADTYGNTTWTSPGIVGGWTIAGNELYTTTITSNVGIGTINPLSKLNVNGGVGIGTSLTNGAYLNGTSAPSGGLIVQGNVGIGTFNPFGGQLIIPTTNGNVGIGTLVPGQALDVNGTLRTTYFTMSSQSPMNGYVLTAADTYGNTTWTSPGIVGGWTIAGNELYTTTITSNVGIGTINPLSKLNVNGGVGIGTSLTNGNYLNGNAAPSGGLIVQGNVGFGTWAPTGALEVEGGNVGIGTWLAPSGGANNLLVNGNVGVGTTFVGGAGEGSLSVMNGNVGIGTWLPFNSFDVKGSGAFGTYAGQKVAPANSLIVSTNIGIGTYNPNSALIVASGNVGIGTAFPGQVMDVNGTLRTTYFTMSSQSPMNGYVLTAADTYGNTTWTSPGIVGGWTIAGNELYTTTITSNVGIGTINPLSKLNVNGGVGIGTSLTNGNYLNGNAAPSGGLIVQGNVGIGTYNPNNSLIVGSGNVGIGSAFPGQSLDVQGSVRALGEFVNGNVGIGTSFVNSAGEGSLSVMNGNVGIGTWLPSNALDLKGSAAFGTYAGKYTAPSNSLIVSTNLGIGTYNPNSALIVASGNVGIGTAFPGQVMDVNGTLRTTYFTMSSQSPVNGDVLSAVDTYGDVTWTAVAGNFNYWLTDAGNIGINTTYNVGIGTLSQINSLNILGNIGIGTFSYDQYMKTAAPNGGAIISGNVGIGTWVPFNSFDVKGSAAFGTYAGQKVAPANSLIVSTNVGIGTYNPNNSLIVGAGNVGIGTAFPGQVLDVQGTLRTTYFTMSSQSPVNGDVLSAVDTYGDVTWTAVAGNFNYWLTDAGNIGINTTYNVGIGTLSQINSLNILGNIGIGTFSYDQYMKTAAPNGGAIISGNVGIGTWEPVNSFDVKGSAAFGTYAGQKVAPANSLIVSTNVGIGTYNPNNSLIVGSGNVGIGSAFPGQSLDVQGSVRALGEFVNGNVGIGTSFVNSAGEGSLSVMNGNVGIGTWLPSNALDLKGSAAFGTYAGKYTAPSNSLIVSTNLGIGTYNPNSALIVASGNVGIGTAFPGQALDVTGTVRTQYFTMSSQSPVNGDVLTAIDTYGDTTWTAVAGNFNYWLTDAGNIGINTTYNVGIGTLSQINSLNILGNIGIGTFSYDQYMKTAAPNGGAIISGNVGIGTWVPFNSFDVKGSAAFGTYAGQKVAPANSLIVSTNVGIGTYNPNNSLIVGSGNVGIGSAFPGQSLDVQGTVRALGEFVNGNVGVGTSFINAAGEAALSVMNGNVGFGTWTTVNILDVNGSSAFGSYAGKYTAPSNSLIVSTNIGIGTYNPNNSLIVASGNVGIGSAFPGQMVDVQGTVRAFNFIGNGSQLSGILGTTQWSGTSGNPIYYSLGNVGIGTSLTMNGLDIATNVSIGTAYAGYKAAPPNGLLVQGNVGLGSTAPGQALDVTGTVRTQYFAMSTQSPVNGDVLTAVDTYGDTTWTSASLVGSNYFLKDAGNIGINTSYNIGIGTLSQINSLNILGNVGIGTVSYSPFLTTAPGANGMIVEGNVGIGTTKNSTAGLTVMNGNVGIGTWVPRGQLDVEGTLSVTTFAGNVGIGTWVPNAALSINGNLNFATDNTYNIGGSSGNRPSNIYLAGANGGVEFSGGGSLVQSGGSVFLAGDSGNGVDLASGATDWLILKSTGNIGIGQNYSSPTQLFDVNGKFVVNGTSGNVGIGTTVPGAGLDVEGTLYPTVFYGHGTDFNVGIGSLTPGQALDVTGTVRTQYFTMSSQSPVNGEVLTAIDTYGDTTWTSAAGNFNYWLNDAGNIGINTAYNVGIGTLSQINALNVLGNVGIGTVSYSKYLTTQAPRGGMIIEGNVGIGSLYPGQSLDIQGSVRNLGEFVNGNVGIGTSFVNGAGEGALSVMNGNVGIGTWVPASNLQVTGQSDFGSAGSYVLLLTAGSPEVASNTSSLYLGTNSVAEIELSASNSTSPIQLFGVRNQPLQMGTNSAATSFTIMPSNNIGIGTIAPLGALDVEGTLYPTVFYGTGTNFNVGIGSFHPGQALDVQGTVRTQYFTMSSQSPTNGEVLTAIDTYGDTTWTAVAGNFNYWLNDAGNIGINTAYNVGIGTLSQINALNVLGNVGIGTVSYSKYLTTQAPKGGMIIEGNVGIGSLYPGQSLDIQGSVRNLGEFVNGNVGIGTSFVNGAGEGALSVMNGNVGIGTWVPNYLLQVGSGTSVFQASSAGNTYVSGTMVVNENNGVEFSNGISATRFAQISSSGGGNLEMQVNNTVNGIYILSNGNVGINSVNPVGELDVEGSLYPTIFYGSGTDQNVGIGSLSPGQALDVTGTVRTQYFTMSSQSPVNGEVLTAIDTYGDTTWTSAAGNFNYWLNDAGNIGINTAYNVGIGTLSQINALNVLGNVGIGTVSYSKYLTTQAPRGGMIIEGNVGIGSLYPGQSLDIQGSVRNLGEFVNGNVGIGTSFVNGAGEGALSVMNGNVGIGTWVPADELNIMGGNVSIGTKDASYLLEVGSGSSNFDVNSGGSMYAESIEVLDSTGIAFSNGFQGGVYATIASSLSGNLSLTVNNTSNGINILSNGNVGINTLVPAGELDVEGTLYPTVFYGRGTDQNVGIGSLSPGQALDVTGTVRTQYFTMSSQSPVNGEVLTAIDTYGDTTWTSAAGTFNYWLNDAGNIGINTAYNVGIGTLSQINALNVLGNVGIGTVSYSKYLTTAAPRGGLIVEGNVGIGSLSPGQSLDIQGSVRNIGEFVNGNVGIGTSFVNGVGEGSLTVMNGNVGIGTWLPSGQLDVEGTLSTAIFAGNVGIGTWVPGYKLQVSGGRLEVDSTSTPAFIVNLTGGSGAAASLIQGSSNSIFSFYNGLGFQIQQHPLSDILSGIGNASDGVFYVNSNGGAAIGTYAASSVSVANGLLVPGNVGIGTFNPFGGGLIVIPSNTGNVGIGSLTPGQALDVTGTVRTQYFTMSSQSPTNGSVLTAVDTYGDTTWTPAASIANYWLNDAGNIGINTAYNVGIGTLSQINALNVLGNVGIGTVSYSKYLTTQAPRGGMIIEGNVGIGSLYPGQSLDIQGSVRNLGEFVNGNVGIGTSFVNGAGEGALSVMNGNVGIGTWVPGYLFQVTSNAFNQEFDVSSAGNTYASGTTFVNGLEFSNAIGGGRYAELNATSSGNLSIEVNNTTNGMYISSNGNVGINTVAPAGELDVEGTLYPTVFYGRGTDYNVGIGSLTPGQALDVTGTVRTQYFAMSSQSPVNGEVLTAIDTYGDTTWTAVAGNFNYWLTDVGNIGINTSYNVGIGTLSQINSLNILGNVGIGTVSGDKYLTTVAPKGGAIIYGNVGIGTWLPSGQLDVEGTLSTAIFAGNVGIGTWVPADLLNVMGNVSIGTTTASNYLTVGSTGEEFVVDSAGSAYTTGIFINSNSLFGIEFSNSYKGTRYANITSDSSSDLLFDTTSSLTERMRIDTNGNVGIGTINPFSRLNVNGGIGIGTSLTNGAYLNGNGAPSGGLIVQGNVGIGTFNPFDGGLIVIPSNTGNVGIGSVTPGQALDVAGTVRTQYFTMSSQSPVNGEVLTAIDTYGDTTWTAVAGNFNYWLTDAGNIGINTSYNVGIGTLSQINALNVLGNVGIGTVSYSKYLTTQAPRGGMIIEGNVGIGSLYPGQSLDIQGSVRNLGEFVNGNVGIGTSFVNGAGEGSLTVMNGNVGIGTWVPGNLFQIGNGATPPLAVTSAGNMTVSGTVTSNVLQSSIVQGGNAPSQILYLKSTGSAGTTDSIRLQVNNGGTEAVRIQDNSGTANIGIGTTVPASMLDVEGSLTPVLFFARGANQNVGIGSLTPGQALDVTGTVRTQYFTMSSQSPTNGEVLTAIDTYGDTTWTSPAGTFNYWLNDAGNIGINTAYNIGIGTLSQINSLNILGNVGIGTFSYDPFMTMTAPSGGMIVSGNVGIGTWLPASTFTIKGSMSVAIVTKSGNYTASANDSVILVNAGGAVLISLPAAASVPGREYVIKKIDATANPVTISDGTANIDGQASVTTTIQYQSYTIISDGANWDII